MTFGLPVGATFQAEVRSELFTPPVIVIENAAGLELELVIERDDLCGTYRVKIRRPGVA